MSEHIPALSIRQPWAELILRGEKSVEIRSWSANYRGPFWLHTGLAADPALEEQFGLRELFKGGYIGRVTLSAVVPLDPRRWELWRSRHLDAGIYQPGTYGWILSSAQRFREPVPSPGRLNLFFPAPEVEAQLWQAEFAPSRVDLSQTQPESQERVRETRTGADE